jgi:hypothetical protein
MTFTLFIDDQCEILKKLLELYYPHGARIIDLTYGKGNLWKKIQADKTLRAKYKITACDAKPTSRKVKRKNLLTSDYTKLGKHDCALFDPPYLIKRTSFDYQQVRKNSWSADKNRKKYTQNQSIDIFNQRVKSLAEKAHTFLKPNGILLIKIMDPRHNGELIPHHHNIINLLSNKFELIDLAIYVRLGATTWKINGHLQNLHGYWEAFRLKGEMRMMKTSSTGS